MPIQTIVLSAALVGALLFPAVAYDAASEKPAAFWNAPTDISALDLFHGQGGAARAPLAEPFEFVEEDKDGVSPKIVVRDRDGLRWKVKLGPEARPEVAVTRFVWAMGYAVDEDYFVAAQEVQNLPSKLSRGSEFVSGDGIVMNARWERMDQKKEANWKWAKNPFSGTRELNGLRVLMALFNNYDMKDSQNTVYSDASGQTFLVGDLGATLGPTGSKWPGKTPKGDPKHYARSKFVTKVTDDYVDFAAPSWPMMFGVIPLPPLPYSYLTVPMMLFGRPAAPNITEQRWIGKRVPRKDVAWMAAMLRQLTPLQIREALRAGGYSPEEIEGLSAVVRSRIAELDAI